jgi:hypothetical protein
MERHAVLQSGFIATTGKGLTTSPMEKDPFVDFTLNKDHLKNRNDYFYSDEITEAYKYYLKNKECIKSIDFKEKVLSFAFGQFPKDNFYDWIELQYKSGNLSQLHGVFLTETISLVLYNLPRKLEAGQWGRLLENSIESKATLIDFHDYFKKWGYIDRYKNSADFAKQFTDVQTLPLIKMWTSNDTMFVDLLTSMYVIFGSRYDITDVATNIRGY